MPRLLVVDDEAIIRHSFARAFAGRGVEVLSAGTVAEGRDRVAADRPDVVVADLQLPDGTGLELFEEISQANPRLPVIIITAHGTTDAAIEAMKRGAFDYLLKPLDLERTTQLLDRAFEASRLMRSPAALPGEPSGDRIIGRSAATQDMCKAVGRIAAQDINVLILGESGTGKELVARAIYQHSRRADKPFLAINCAALPEALVESELFGHEQGAFTGALRQRIGKFEQCDGGTLLLDEIGDMTPGVQAKMLRLLQDQTFERVGGNQTLTTRVRVLAATHRNLEQLVADGKFREDLYYRLKVVTIPVPALRDRAEDIPDLANYFLSQFAREVGRDVRGFAPGVFDLLRSHPWPGNIRELQGAVRSAILRTADPLVRAEDIQPSLGGGGPATQAIEAPTGPAKPSGPSLADTIEGLLRDGQGNVHGRVVEAVEREVLARALRYTHGHQANASQLLGINRATLRAKLRELGLALDKIVTDQSTTEE